jgi:uncharacterized OB-fold protein
MPKGQKTCNNCGHIMGPRKAVCDKCGKQLIGNLKYTSIKVDDPIINDLNKQ